MTTRLVALSIGLIFGTCAAVGQNSKVDVKSEESAIRAIIAREAALPNTADRISWSGATGRPAVGSQRPEPFPEANVGKRKNVKRGATKVERLEVASSGEMAWEFSYGNLSYDLDETPTRHVNLDTGILRVWKKVNGEWKVAASFIRPLDVAFAPQK